MKVSKCSEVVKVAEKPKVYSREELFSSATEGVYREADSSPDTPLRLVVLGEGVYRTVLWSSNGTLEGLNRRSSGNRYILTNATVCFEIKE